jgi:ATP-dependent Zn protease
VWRIQPVASIATALPPAAVSRNPRFPGGRGLARDYAEQTAAAVDREVKAIVDRVLERTEGMLTKRRSILDRSAKKLLERVTLEQSDIDALIRMPKEGLRAV